jgi:hypothetical protein
LWARVFKTVVSKLNFSSISHDIQHSGSQVQFLQRIYLTNLAGRPLLGWVLFQVFRPSLCQICFTQLVRVLGGKVVILNLFGKSQLLSFADLIDGFTFLSFVC